MKLLNGPEFKRLQGAIGAAETRQQVIADNIANVDVPYFKRSEVVFEEMLEQQLNAFGTKELAGKRTLARHIPIGSGSADLQPRIVTDQTSVMNNNVNNVDIDREMALLAKNQLRYNAMIQQLNHEVRMMRTAMEGRA
ncbi:flagellar basal-body rod protein FlgB [Paenibacillus darwinianus]|uniref:Flagellar basal body rod protein FlgB n=1 Tax=Paenibacillus darwinianus TaxID=1380763 RepID=A0A9W5S2J1_9BACL|nr:flagellar basal body rod protein FlgB [Paenibacillus darwinianus]EXX91379.1 flagellar basal-body rod protein FlgB [Paenibacillus darwinianus]EXX92285.1 flagellar basal-body rod protein FlgB [Paenibacillus darwinianus]EXX92857.1 flagellar basal-body rod protein FlgB [Paenibacillus darwinianus]